MTATGSLSARDLAGAPRLQGTLETEPFHPRKVLERLGIRLPATSDPKALHSASIKTDFAATADSAELEHMVVALDDSQISGNVAVRDFETPALDFDVTVDRIDVDRYLPPSAAAGAASRAPAAPGTAAAPGAATASAMATAVETLRGLNATGRIEVGRLQVGGVPLADVRAVIEAKGGLINAAPLSASRPSTGKTSSQAFCSLPYDRRRK